MLPSPRTEYRDGKPWTVFDFDFDGRKDCAVAGTKVLGFSVFVGTDPDEDAIHSMFIDGEEYHTGCTPSRMTIWERIKFSWLMLREVWTN